MQLQVRDLVQHRDRVQHRLGVEDRRTLHELVAEPCQRRCRSLDRCAHVGVRGALERRIGRPADPQRRRIALDRRKPRLGRRWGEIGIARCRAGGRVQ